MADIVENLSEMFSKHTVTSKGSQKNFLFVDGLNYADKFFKSKRK